MKQARKPVIIVGADLLSRPDGEAILASLQSFANSLKKGKVFNVLQRNAGQTGALDVGYTPGVEEVFAKKPKVLYLLGADANVIRREDIGNDTFVIYQGMHNASI